MAPDPLGVYELAGIGGGAPEVGEVARGAAAAAGGHGEGEEISICGSEWSSSGRFS